MTTEYQDHKLLALCLLKTKCPDHGDTADQGVCPTCLDSQTVWLLDPTGEFGLREECIGWPMHPDFYDYGQTYCTNGAECLCQDRGWTPTQNLWAYVRAACAYLQGDGSVSPDELAISWLDAIDGLIRNALRYSHTDPGQAAFGVVWKALKEGVQDASNS